MPLTRRSFGASLLAGTSGLLGAAIPEESRFRPKLLVLIVAEQFRSDYLDRVGSSLGKGGLRRLMRDAAYYPNSYHLSGTFTATGLANLSTGAYPSLHGIVADTWYDPATRAPVTARPEALLASTFARQIPEDPYHRVFGVGMDPQSTAFLAGPSPTLAVYMGSGGQFVAVKGEEPAWLKPYNQAHPIENLHNAKWVAMGAGAGVPPLRVLRYNPSSPEDFLLLYRSSPFAQMAEFEVMRELIAGEQIGQRDSIDFLVLALGAMTQLGYDVGANSPLMDQMVLHLDRQIELTLETLNRTVGANNFTLVFTAAHGAPPEPPRALRSRMAISGEAVARSINRALAERFGTPEAAGPYVEKYVYPFVYLRHEMLRQNKIDPRLARSVAGMAALSMDGVFAYYTADDASSHYGEWKNRFRHSFYPPRSGDLMLSYRPEYVEDYGSGRGISYGSVYNYDARVPLFLLGPHFRTRMLERRIEAIDLAPTLAAVYGLAPPSSSTGRILSEALKMETMGPAEERDASQ